MKSIIKIIKKLIIQIMNKSKLISKSKNVIMLINQKKKT